MSDELFLAPLGPLLPVCVDGAEDRTAWLPAIVHCWYIQVVHEHNVGVLEHRGTRADRKHASGISSLLLSSTEEARIKFLCYTAFHIFNSSNALGRESNGNCFCKLFHYVDNPALCFMLSLGAKIFSICWCLKCSFIAFRHFAGCAFLPLMQFISSVGHASQPIDSIHWSKTTVPPHSRLRKLPFLFLLFPPCLHLSCHVFLDDLDREQRSRSNKTTELLEFSLCFFFDAFH